MAQSRTLVTQAALARRCSTPTRQLKQSTIQYLLKEDDPRNPQLDTIVAIAEAFGVRPWQLLDPEFDAASRTGGKLPPPEIIDLAIRLTKNRELLLQVFETSQALRALSTTGEITLRKSRDTRQPDVEPKSKNKRIP